MKLSFPNIPTPELESEFREFEGRYATLHEQLVSQVVTWRYATDEMLQIEPFAAEKHRYSRTKWIPDATANPLKHVRHGFSLQDEILLMQHQFHFPTGVRQDETLILRKKSNLDVLRFEDVTGIFQRQLRSFTRCQHEKQRVERIEGVNYLGGAYREEFFYQDSRLVRSVAFADDRRPHGRRITNVYEYGYSALGNLVRITLTSFNSESLVPLGSEVAYQRPERREIFQSLLADLEEVLFETTIRRLTDLKLSEAVYCLLLVYDRENDLFPPLLALGAESERQAAHRRYGANAGQYLWNPADMTWFNRPELILNGPQLKGICDKLNSILTNSQRCRAAIKGLNRVAKRLMEIDWHGILSPTDDFVVVAVDLESQDDFLSNAKASVGAKRLAKLNADGLL